MPQERSYGSRDLAVRMWRDYLKPYRWQMSAAMIFMMIEGSTLGILSWTLKPLFDRVFVGGDVDAMWWVGGTILGLYVTRATTLVINRALLTRISQSVAVAMQSDMLRHILTLDGPFFQSNPPGALIERIQGDARAVQDVWKTFITGAGRDFVALTSLLVVAVSIDLKWTLAAFVGVPILVMPMVLVQRYIRRKMGQTRAVASSRATRLDEILHGIDAVRLNRMEAYQTRRFDQILGRIRNSEIKMAAIGSVIPALIDIITGLGFIGVLWLGGAEVSSGARSVGDFMAFFTAMALTFQPLRRLGGLAGGWQVAAASLERIYALFDRHSAILGGARTAPPPDTRIVLSDVHVRYGDAEVLSGLTFTAEPGQTTALVGPSGAGKSTVFKLLTRLVDPTSGQITLGGIDLRDYSLDTLRGQFSAVSQEAVLFDETISENVTVGTAAVPEALRAAIEAAHVADFIDALPDGLQAPVGPRGSALSGGQRQRVAIARAILRDAPVLLLDEATSALDTASERLVQAALEQASQGRTTLIIAHRLSTIRNSDKIVVIDKGRVVEEGDHDSLMARNGRYARLVSMQYGDPS